MGRSYDVVPLSLHTVSMKACDKCQVEASLLLMASPSPHAQPRSKCQQGNLPADTGTLQHPTQTLLLFTLLQVSTSASGRQRASGQWRGCAVLDYDNLIHYQTSGGFITEGKNYHVPGPATRAPSHDSTHQIPGCRIASHAASGRRMGPLCSNRTLDPCKACRIAYSAIETVSVI